ncbi:unnamed protein product [Lactuca virosa]|uniref:Uncharacterized protein n=1 Tax=Lactuca virosa TaxID=75947 RepID=A0AAU9NY17_9ASTR|nr:unnamed protein product [Lactuca virosa]
MNFSVSSWYIKKTYTSENQKNPPNLHLRNPQELEASPHLQEFENLEKLIRELDPSLGLGFHRVNQSENGDEANSQRDQRDEGERCGGAREAVAHTAYQGARWPLIAATICTSYSSDCDWSLSGVMEDWKWSL